MKTITELNRERLIIRKSNPVRSTILGLLIDGATKLAKEENRQVEEKDLYLTAQRSVKEIEKDIELLKSKNYSTVVQEVELEIWKEFLPKLLTKGEIKRIILQSYSEELLIKSNFSKIMKEMKLIGNMDMSLLSKILNEILK